MMAGLELFSDTHTCYGEIAAIKHLHFNPLSGIL
jgi:hypothetical protein